MIVAVPVVMALVSAKPFAGAWNDGSRLAAVEALGDHGTFAVDDFIGSSPERLTFLCHSRKNFPAGPL